MTGAGVGASLPDPADAVPVKAERRIGRRARRWIAVACVGAITAASAVAVGLTVGGTPLLGERAGSVTIMWRSTSTTVQPFTGTIAGRRVTGDAALLGNLYSRTPTPVGHFSFHWKGSVDGSKFDLDVNFSGPQPGFEVTGMYGSHRVEGSVRPATCGSRVLRSCVLRFTGTVGSHRVRVIVGRPEERGQDTVVHGSFVASS